MLLLGNKCDLMQEKKVSTEKAQEYADKRKAEFFEISAKTSEKVE
jgi:hypothetical protein